MKKIEDISPQEIREGNNWKVKLPKDLNTPLEQWEIEQEADFHPEDRVAYSAVYVTDDGNVTPLIMIREVGHLDYGGDYCEFRNGGWVQLGLEPNPEAKPGKEYVANPLQNDPSFGADQNIREDHRKNFQKWVSKIN